MRLPPAPVELCLHFGTCGCTATRRIVDALLEQTAAPALVMTADGVVEHANERARVLLDRDGAALVARVRKAARRGSRGVRITCVASAGSGALIIAVLSDG